MSIRVMAKVWDSFPRGGTDLLTMLALADWSDDEGRCFPSITSISKKIRLGKRQAQRSVNGLIDEEFLKVLANLHGGPPGSSRRYQFNFNKLTDVTEVTPINETGVIGDADGCHIKPATGDTHDTLTVIESSLTVSAKFAQFWKAYPKKKSKGDAEKAFNKINPDDKTFALILNAIRVQSQSVEWNKDNGKFVKYPASWLRSQSWLDDVDSSDDDFMVGVL